MTTHVLTAPISQSQGNLDGKLRNSLTNMSFLFQAQPAPTQRMLELQASLISKALVERQSPLRFILPAQVLCAEDGRDQPALTEVPEYLREQRVGGLLDLLRASDLNTHLKELEASPQLSIATSGRLVRHAVAWHMVYRMLPVPRRITDQRPLSAYALGCFMPQWVALDEQDNLLVTSLEEAKVCIAAMQNYLSILDMAVWLAPYFKLDAEYRRKHESMMAQLTVQGRALARHQTGEIIRRIRRRAAENSLNRGFSLSLPYFDDQALAMRLLEIEIIPRGRIMFTPAFVVIAVRAKELEVEHSPGIYPSTRQHLLEELRILVEAFDRCTE